MLATLLLAALTQNTEPATASVDISYTPCAAAVGSAGTVTLTEFLRHTQLKQTFQSTPKVVRFHLSLPTGVYQVTLSGPGFCYSTLERFAALAPQQRSIVYAGYPELFMGNEIGMYAVAGTFSGPFARVSLIIDRHSAKGYSGPGISTEGLVEIPATIQNGAYYVDHGLSKGDRAWLRVYGAGKMDRWDVPISTAGATGWVIRHDITATLLESAPMNPDQREP